MKVNKLVIILLVIIILLLGAFAYIYFKGKSPTSPADTANKDTVSSEKVWNPYATTKRFLMPLNDFLISASHGDHVVKMSVTLEFAAETDVQKFNGWEAEGKIPAAAANEGGSSVKTLSPMEIVVNTIVNDTMLNLDNNSLDSIPAVQKELKSQLNKKLNLGDTFIKEIYVDNYLIQ